MISCMVCNISIQNPRFTAIVAFVNKRKMIKSKIESKVLYFAFFINSFEAGGLVFACTGVNK